MNFHDELQPAHDAEPPRHEITPAVSFWRKLGGGSLTISLLVHAIILAVGVVWVFRVIQDPKPQEQDFLPGGSSGGGGQRGAQHDVKKKKQAALMPSTTPKRVFAQGASSNFSLPPQNDSFGEMSQLSALQSGGTSGGLGGSGSGGGLGNGTGKGAGSGVGHGFGGTGAGSKLFGMPMITGGKVRVALYLDDSNSMKPYLDRVESEAKRIFPEADVFRANAILTTIKDGDVMDGARDKHPSGHGRGSERRSINKPEQFSEIGKKFLRAHEDAFQKGSVGSWFDHIITEKYDALIIFSDFNDGIVQYDDQKDVIYRDTPQQQLDNRKHTDKQWEERWYRTLAKAKSGEAPMVFCFSIKTPPQKVWEACTKQSGGAIKMVDWITKPGGQPPATDDGVDANKIILDGMKRRKTGF